MTANRLLKPRSKGDRPETATTERRHSLLKPKRSLWPTETWHPEIRLILGLFLAPLITMIVAYTLVSEVYRLTETDIESAAELSSRFWRTGLIALYEIAGACALLTIPLLWLSGRRSAIVWMAVGVLAGVLVAVINTLVLGIGFSTVPLLVFAFLGAWNMVFARLVSGVREDRFLNHRGGKP